MTVLVTGTAGFIGYHLTKRLLEAGHQVIGIDNINDYPSPELKFARLNELGIARVDAELEENERYLKVVSDPYQAADKAHAIAVLTEWDEFKGYDYARIFDQMLKPAFIFDGRRLLDKNALKEQGFKVYTIGE